jgi:cold shock CspA family protein
MFTGLVVTACGKGCWLIERSGTRDCVWAHQRHVVGRKFLRPGDRVKFNIVANPLKPNETMADAVEIVGLTVARQVGNTVRP